MDELFAGVDLGGTTIECALATRDGRIVCERKFPTASHEGPEGVLARIAQVIQELSTSARRTPQALGMGIPGLVDVEQGVTRFLPNMPTHWRDVPAARLLSPQVHCPVQLLNDVRMATLGEMTYGHGRAVRSMAFFALGTGIGGGIVVDGKLRLGAVGAAGELGHLTILPDGLRCGCGNRGCLETLASGPAITAAGVRLLLSGLAPHLHRLVGGDAGRVTPKEMAAAAQAGDERVREAILQAADYLAIGVANVVVTVHPELVVIGGGVAEMGALLLDQVRQSVRQRVRMIPLDSLRIERSQLGDKAGLLGGIALACGALAAAGSIDAPV